MSMDYVRTYYRVPAKRGGRVEYTGEKSARFGTIVSANNGRINIRLDGEKHPSPFHPLWELRYLDAPLEAESYLICDLRTEWKGKPYITFWRPNNANYAYPLSWAGDYTKATVDAAARYYTEMDGRTVLRFAVARGVAEAIAEAPEPGHIDGDKGPVVRNSGANRRVLRKAAYLPAGFLEGSLNG